MRISGIRSSTLVVAILLTFFAAPASGQWFDTSEVPGGEGDIIQPFTLMGFNLASGAGLSTWIAPGTSEPDALGLSFLLRGGYRLSSIPIYLGVELPLSFASYISPVDGSDASQFVIGNAGLVFKYRLDPFEETLGIFTGWSLNIYLPTAWIPDDADDPWGHVVAHGFGLGNSLMGHLHAPESMAIVATFSVVLPGKIIYGQVDLSPAVYIPVADTADRETAGAFIWGAAFGVHIIEEIAFLLEFKGFTPLNIEGSDTAMAISPGFRMNFGMFEPALWVSIPLNSQYRQGHPDVVIGLDLSFSF
ncbi:MAG: hypothetical protein JRJ19_02980 [Deltaproteobacteria bacterium]|nr:hypothetical protein [Deltaproteobacteria bacterium]MBW1870997.1 hypothetical protein [Deltaproteobacteria bacterium]